MNQEARSFDDKEAVTFPAEIDMPHAIRITDVCSITPRSVPEAVREHLIVLSNFRARCWGESVQMDTDVLRQNRIFQEIIQSCLTDVTFNKGMVQSSHAGSEEKCWAGLGWAVRGTRGLRVTCPRPGLSLWAANMVPSRGILHPAPPPPQPSENVCSARDWVSF